MKWTKDKCKEEALKYNYQKDFKINCSGAYNVAYNNNWMKEICFHMIKKKKPNGYWTKEICKNIALQYDTRSEFQKKSPEVYYQLYKNNWTDEICSHMKILKFRKKNWTIEKCRELALLCNSRKEFKEKYDSAHRIACKNKWIDEICSHMKPINTDKRCIYAYEFSDNCVYVGLTSNLNKRKNKHKNENNSSVFIHINETELIPNIIQLTDYIDINEAKNKEQFYVEKYKINKWTILNRATTGSLGGITIIWTKEKCLEAAKGCQNRSEFWEKHSAAAVACIKNDWMRDIHLIIKCKTKEKGYWNNYENCLKEAKFRKTRTNFRKYGSGAFKSCVKNNWVNKIYADMNWIKNKRLF